MSTRSAAKPGEQFHFVVTGFTFAESTRGNAGTVRRRGLDMTVTTGMIEAGRDRVGFCWLDLLHDSDAQPLRFGQVVAEPGPFPAGELTTEPGSFEHDEARRRAMAQARAVGNEAARLAAVREVDATYGSPALTSRSLTTTRR